MKLNFLGTGSAFFPVYGNTCAYFLNGNDLYLIDCGESAFGILYEKNILDTVENVYVLITHLHADHVGSLGSLISYFYCLREIQVQVIHPEHTIVDLLTLEGIDRAGYIYSETLPENGAGLEAEAVKVHHVDNMICYGYVLKDSEACIYYSGDSADVPETVRERFLDGRIGRIYHDTSTHDSPEPSHCYYGKLEKAFPAERRGEIYCMHLDSSCEHLLREKGFRIAGSDERKIE